MLVIRRRVGLFIIGMRMDNSYPIYNVYMGKRYDACKIPDK